MQATVRKMNGYWALIKEFPLCPIKNDGQYRQAISVMKNLAGKSLHPQH